MFMVDKLRVNYLQRLITNSFS